MGCLEISKGYKFLGEEVMGYRWPLRKIVLFLKVLEFGSFHYIKDLFIKTT